MRRAQAMKQQMTGQLPRMITPRSPLIDLLESMGPRERLRHRGVRLNPALGYHCDLQFHTCEQLLRWLKPEAQMLENESWPAESRDKRFNQPLSADDLKPFCADYPGKGADK
jgi:hypothetical protein